MTEIPVSVAAPELFGTGPLLGNLDRLRELRDFGFTALELWSPWQVDSTNVAEVRAALDSLGMTVSCVSSPSYLHGETTGEGGRLIAASITLAAELGAGRVNTYFGHGGTGDDRAAASTYARMVEPLLRQADAADVTIVLENEFDAFGHDPEHYDISRRARSLHHLVRLVDHPRFRLNFDAANFACAGENVAAAAALLAPDVGYVHVKDVVTVAPEEDGGAPEWNRYTDGDNAYRTVQLGTGEVPWSEVLDRLAAVGYDGPFTLEPHCRADALFTQLAVSRSYIQGSVA
ncbi:sugar phosphate isomerase/epimerase [Streptomyces violaceoruber]|uniref:sugar phosphate isomerase/epimerase family protein n=1 Tax=Streptomyces violaceoruber TaxID=1935 RepID=UPI001F38A96A|nr:sugar phosphate isomerase/epimerase family protein [Streptomyces violaceoruber]MCF3165790.1 sugar phosphate isomerase/epimerase [Streptomyces violaceoruber]